MPFYDSNTSVLTTNPYGARDETLGMDAEQVECVGTALAHSHDDDRLADLMDGLSAEFCSKKDELMRLKAVALSHRGRFGEVYRLIESHKFASPFHHQMQRLWDEAHYKETSIGRNKFELDAVTRYRVRKKYPYPSTIWDGEGTSYCFKKRDRAVLKDAYRKNHMPSQQEKQELAQRTNLSVTQVSNWFKNQRQRARQQTRDMRRGTCRRASSASADEESEREDGKREEETEHYAYSNTENKPSTNEPPTDGSSLLLSMTTAGSVSGFPAAMPYPPCYAAYYAYPFALRHVDTSLVQHADTESLSDTVNALLPAKYERL